MENLAGYVNRSFFPDNGHLDLTRIGHLRLYFLSNLKAKFIAVVVSYSFSLYDHP